VEYAFHAFHLPIDRARERLREQRDRPFVRLFRFGATSIENFTDDFAVWVVFCGPMGGENGAKAESRR
jgi:hypothetical protein